MKGCKNLCNKETPHIDGVKVLSSGVGERFNLPGPCTNALYY